MGALELRDVTHLEEVASSHIRTAIDCLLQAAAEQGRHDELRRRSTSNLSKADTLRHLEGRAK